MLFISPTIYNNNNILSSPTYQCCLYVDFERDMRSQPIHALRSQNKSFRFFFFFIANKRTNTKIRARAHSLIQRRKRSSEWNSDSKSLCLSYNHKNYIIESIKWIDGRTDGAVSWWEWRTFWDSSPPFSLYLTTTVFMHTRAAVPTARYCTRALLVDIFIGITTSIEMR